MNNFCSATPVSFLSRDITSNRIDGILSEYESWKCSMKETGYWSGLSYSMLIQFIKYLRFTALRLCKTLRYNMPQRSVQFAKFGTNQFVKRKMVKFICLLIVSLTLICEAHALDDVKLTPLCQTTDQLAKNGFYTQASQLLQKALDETNFSNEGDSCIVGQLAQIKTSTIKSHIDSSELMIAQGRSTEAVKLLLEGIVLYPHSRELQDKLIVTKRLNDPYNIKIERIKMLYELGQRTEAAAALSTLLKESDPNLNNEFPVPDGLKSVFGGKRYLWLKSNVQNVSVMIVPILEILGIGILLLAVFCMLFRRFISNHRVLIGQIGKGGFEADHLGSYFTSNVNSHLDEIVRDTQRGGLHVVTGPIDNIKLPTEVVSIVPDTTGSVLSTASVVKAIPALLNFMFEPRTISVTGELSKAGGRGIGVSVSLSKSKKVLSSYTIWFSDFEDKEQPGTYDDEEKLYLLSQHLAIWIVFKLTKLLTNKRLNLLGTEDWRSYSYFKSGVLAGDEGRNDAAIRLYTRSLICDKRHRGSRLNLALKLNRLGKRGQARAHLKKLYNDSLNIEGAMRDPCLYSAAFNLATYYAEDNDEGAAIDLLQRLLEKIQTARCQFKWAALKSNPSKLKLYLTEIEPSAKIMLGTLLVAAGGTDPAEALKFFQDASTTSVEHQYNLACAYSTIAGLERLKPQADTEQIEKYLVLALSHLSQSLNLNDEQVMRQVGKDPNLKDLREFKEAGYKDLVAQYQPLTETSSVEDEQDKDSILLDQFSLFSPRELRLLEELSIVSFSDLRTRSSTKKKRKELASQVGEPKEHIEKWVNATELTKLQDIEPDHIDHFLSLKIGGLKILSKQKPQELMDALKALENIPESWNLTIETVRCWIDQAKNTPTLI